MPLIQLLGVLIVIGVLLWLVNRFIPMAGSIKSILNAVVVIGVVLWLLDVFGLFHSLSRIVVEYVGRPSVSRSRTSPAGCGGRISAREWRQNVEISSSHRRDINSALAS